MNRGTANILMDDAAVRQSSIFAGRLPPANLGPCRCAVSHDFAALGLHVGGASYVEHAGVTWALEAGDMLVVPAGEPHRPVEVHRPDIWGLGFFVPCLAAETRAALLEPFERVRDGASPVVRIAPDRQAFLESLFKEMTRADSADASVKQSLLTLILSEVARSAGWSNVGASDRSIVARSLHFIEQHCLEPLTLNQVAAAMQRTPSYVTTALTRATGRSAVDWIITGRMAEARRCLLHSDERVDVIAERVGYADATHFVRMFRRTHGFTPAAWRASHRRAQGW